MYLDRRLFNNPCLKFDDHIKDQGKRNEITTLGTVGSSRRNILYINEYIYIIYIYIIKKPTGKTKMV